MPLYIASHNGHSSVITLFLSRGANPKLSKHSGSSLMHIAAKRGHTECLKLLIPVSDLNEQVDNGSSPLILAYFNGKSDCVEELLNSGANTDLLDKWGNDALARATEEEFDKYVLLLLEPRAAVRWNHERSPLKLVQAKGHMEVVRILECFRRNLNKYQL